MPTDCRARIFEILSQSTSTSSDVELPVSMKVTVRSSAAGLAYGLFLNYLDPRAFSGMEPASIINADVMPSRSMPSKAPIALDLYNIFSICTSGRWIRCSPAGSEY